MYRNYTIKQGVPSGYIRKIWLMMRLTAVILIATFMQVGAAGFAQKISMSKSNATLLHVFKEIRTQSGYNFVCPESILKKARPVTINVKNAELETVLNEIFNKQSLTYTIDSKVVVVKEKKASFVDVLFGHSARQDSILFKGRVLNEKGDPLPGATIKLRGGTKASVANPTGYFERYGLLKSVMVISYLGYQTQEFSLRGQDPDVPIIIRLLPGQNELGEVNIVSTGYQDIPKERATGSFEVITKEQLQHSTDPSLLKRLEGITTSMDFRNDTRAINPSSASPNAPVLSTLTIRGKNTLNVASISGASINSNQSGQPLVVIDGIASAFNIESIDPNDVESISILKDAAAASIWGSRAANGVIVIKTKKGMFNRPPRVSFNVNFNTTDKLDLFYKKQMSVSDFVDAQVYANQFDYPGEVPVPTDIYQPQPYMSPVAEILNDNKLGLIDDPEMNRRLDLLRGNDLRRDYTDLFLRNSFVQNYNIAVDGGSKSVLYRLSGNYANTMNSVKGYKSNRYTFNYNATFNPFENFKIDAIIGYTREFSDKPEQTAKLDISENGTPPYFPYTKLVDEQGNPLVVSRDFRPAFISLLEETYGSKILDMRWRPVADVNEGFNKSTTHGINLNLTAGYRISSFLSANVTYSYNKSIANAERLQSQESYYMRQLINRYTDRNGLARNLPLGASYIPENSQSDAHTLRGLLNIDKTWNEKHNVTAIAGIDVSQVYRKSRTDQSYGYDPVTLKVVNQINFKDYLSTLFNGQFGDETATIPYSKTFLDYKNRQFSLFSNAAYSYDSRYTLSASIRKDASSSFGPSTNKTGTPYFSVGGAWNINNEKFYHQDWLPNLKLRVTYGYNGNVNTLVTADPQIRYVQSAVTGLPYANTEVAAIATNSQLRPERSGVLNFGLDFGLKGNRISGSLEYYERKTFDLLTQNRVDPSTGFKALIFNTGNLKARGVDLTLNSLNLRSGGFSWTSNLLFSYNRVKVTKLYVPGANTAGYVVGDAQYTEGYDLSRVFAWKWAGLDPDSGDPRVFLNGAPVKVDGTDYDVVNLLNDAPVSEARYFGSGIPVYFGSFRNTFNYRSFSVSANFLYKLGYYAFRNDVVQYSTLFGEFGNNQPQGAEYAQRWKQSGDEKFTNVPSQVYNPGFDIRDNIYKNSDINVYKADHIRLQEINLSYAFQKPKWFIQNPRLYANISNIGIIWRANKLGIDPDIFDYPTPKTYSLGFSANF